MKKSKKPLTINISQQEHNINFQSPNQKAYLYQTNQHRHLLMYNQHTIASSTNNDHDHEDEQNYDYKQQHDELHQQNYEQVNGNDYVGKLNTKDQRHNSKNIKRKINVVQFQEFSIQDQNMQKDQLKNTLKTTINSNHYNNKRQFTIDIPDQKDNQNNQQPPRGIMTTDINTINIQTKNIHTRQNQVIVRQPPCPSNKSTISNFNKHFIFPVHDEQTQLQSTNRVHNNQIGINQNNNEKSFNKKSLNEQQNQRRVSQVIIQWKTKVQQMNKKFEKERQQFYRQKSNLQKDLMIKDGQIEMLQKLITNRYSSLQDKTKSSKIKNNHEEEQNIQHYNKGFNQNLISSQQKYKSLQTILFEKDLKITQLLQKINELNKLIQIKNNQLEDTKITFMKNQKLNQSLKNQLFILEKKNQNQKLTNEFYKIKQLYHNAQNQTKNINKSHNQTSFMHPPHYSVSKTPKIYSKQKYQFQEMISQSKSKDKTFHHKIQNTLDRSLNQHPMRGIDDLHRRLQSLKMNRIELENRGKIKSEISMYSQTSKYKPKGSFDFKGKYYDNNKDYINRSRMC